MKTRWTTTPRARDVNLPEIVRTRKSSHSCMVNAWSSRSCSASKARATVATSDQKTSFHGSRIRVTGPGGVRFSVVVDWSALRKAPMRLKAKGDDGKGS